VTGDGELRRVTPTRHPDLFFALRGGKGVAGIVTAVEFDLLPIATFYGGAVYFDGQDIPAVIDRWRSWSKALPETATTSFVILQLPDAPDMPPPLAGRTTIGVRFLWVGDAEEGAGLLDQIRAVAPVVIDDAALKPYTAVDSVHADPVDPMPVKEASMLLTDFPDDAVARFLSTASGRARTRRRSWPRSANSAVPTLGPGNTQARSYTGTRRSAC
jgi:FAD/FMN-containing dehydrogenase